MEVEEPAFRCAIDGQQLRENPDDLEGGGGWRACGLSMFDYTCSTVANHG